MQTNEYRREINKKNYDYFQVTFKKELNTKNIIKELSEKQNVSLNEFIISACEDKISRILLLERSNKV